MTRRIGLITFLLLMTTLVTKAEDQPAWTYSAVLTGDRGAAAVRDGFGARLDASAPDGLRHYSGYTVLAHAANLGSQVGTARLNLGGTTYSSFFWDTDGPAGPLDDRFTAAITIRDTRSGASGTVSVTGTAQSADSYLGLPVDLDLPPMPAVWQLSDAHQDLNLGDHVYSVRLGEVKVNERATASPFGSTWDSLEVYADVMASPVPMATPEPGILVLAVIGLGLCGVKRRLCMGRNDS